MQKFDSILLNIFEFPSIYTMEIFQLGKFMFMKSEKEGRNVFHGRITVLHSFVYRTMQNLLFFQKNYASVIPLGFCQNNNTDNNNSLAFRPGDHISVAEVGSFK